MASGSGGTTEYLESSERRVIAAMEIYLDESEDMKVEIGASDGSRRLRSLSEVNPDACKKERQQDFRDENN